MSKQSHIERTASEPRNSSLHTLTISAITQVNPTVRLFHLEIPSDDGFKFLPGQWVDLYPPPQTRILKPGGFTIASSPTLAAPSPASPSRPYIELAVQSSPLNPPAAYLFQPIPLLLHTQVQVRIGGSFVFPPPLLGPSASATGPGATLGSLRKVVFVAGGMGINPLMSMLSWIGEGQGRDSLPLQVQVLYSVKHPDAVADGSAVAGARAGSDGVQNGKGILFLERIVGLFESGRVRGQLGLFLTGGRWLSRDMEGGEAIEDVLRCSGRVDVPFLRRRIAIADVERAVGEEKEAAVVYICGVPAMTDEFVQASVSPTPDGLGMEQRRVLFEKWW